MDKVAVIGLGQMGSRYARRLIDFGYEVTIWNRTPEHAIPLVTAGVRAAQSVAEAVLDNNIVIVALENAKAFEVTLLAPNTLANLTPHHLVIDTGTTDPDESRTANAVISQRRAAYLDAPVSGGTCGAEDGTLTILAGGESAIYERARPVLEVLGTPHLLGPVGAGQIAKLANQAIVAVTIAAVSEGLFLARRAGLDEAQLLSAMQGGFADSRIMREHGDRIVRRDFVPGATNRIFLKDLASIEKLAKTLRAHLPLTKRSQQAFSELVATGFSEEDHSSYFKYLENINSGKV